MAARPVAPGAVDEPELDAVEPGPDADDRAEGVGKEQARLGPPPDQPGGLIGRVLGDQDALVEQARGEFRDAGRAHAEMLADLHPRHGAFAAQGIEQAPAGGFAGRQGQRGHGFTLFDL